MQQEIKAVWKCFRNVIILGVYPASGYCVIISHNLHVPLPCVTDPKWYTGSHTCLTLALKQQKLSLSIAIRDMQIADT